MLRIEKNSMSGPRLWPTNKQPADLTIAMKIVPLKQDPGCTKGAIIVKKPLKGVKL